MSVLCDVGGRATIIVNPYHGDHQENGASITGLLQEDFRGVNNICAGILLRSDMTVDEVMPCYDQHADHHPVLIHAGFTEPKALAAALEDGMSGLTNVFIEDHAKLLYRKHFDKSTRILVRDGFKRLRNADYPEMEEFSDLHVTYGDLGMAGFGDF
ncbi:sce7725 family protein, partial [Burkholderia gladioli]|uniref:sce7725 family protein n=1 Tax=Burkholderia gladioli TaxID=28095 RepID=UPI0024462DDB